MSQCVRYFTDTEHLLLATYILYVSPSGKRKQQQQQRETQFIWFVIMIVVENASRMQQYFNEIVCKRLLPGNKRWREYEHTENIRCMRSDCVLDKDIWVLMHVCLCASDRDIYLLVWMCIRRKGEVLNEKPKRFTSYF